MTPMTHRHLRCDMLPKCTGAVTHIDDHGWIYCRQHGTDRRESGYHRCRQLRPHELRRLERNETITRY